MSHRLAWELQKGPVSDGYSLHHTCKNRKCCNVEHLELITLTDHAALTNKERAGTGWYKVTRDRNEVGQWITTKLKKQN